MPRRWPQNNTCAQKDKPTPQNIHREDTAWMVLTFDWLHMCHLSCSKEAETRKLGKWITVISPQVIVRENLWWPRGPAQKHWPTLDELGQIFAPARVWLILQWIIKKLHLYLIRTYKGQSDDPFEWTIKQGLLIVTHSGWRKKLAPVGPTMMGEEIFFSFF